MNRKGTLKVQKASVWHCQWWGLRPQQNVAIDGYQKNTSKVIICHPYLGLGLVARGIWLGSTAGEGKWTGSVLPRRQTKNTTPKFVKPLWNKGSQYRARVGDEQSSTKLEHKESEQLVAVDCYWALVEPLKQPQTEQRYYCEPSSPGLKYYSWIEIYGSKVQF